MNRRRMLDVYAGPLLVLVVNLGAFVAAWLAHPSNDARTGLLLGLGCGLWIADSVATIRRRRRA